MIIKYPNKILYTKSEDVSLEEGKEIAELLKEEIEGLKWGETVGLAAPQIGLNKNVFIALKKVYFNPKVLAWSKNKEIKQEGCYSLKENKFDYNIERHDSIELTWMNFNGRIRQEKFSGFEAQVIQHEYDHLLGKLCCN